MKTKLIALILLISVSAIGQINFEKGYFINNENQRVECLIKNIDWNNNPEEFEYKLTANSETKKGTLNTIKEFVITGFSKYVTADAKIDVSPPDLYNLSNERDPIWSQQRIFLKVLVEGKGILYYYEKNGLIRFFYSVSDTSVTQLIYKEYYTTDNKVAKNLKFREQLWLYVRCDNASMSSVENIHYRESELIEYFKKFNQKDDTLSAISPKKGRNNSYHLKVCPGINYSSVSIKNTSLQRYNTDFDNKINFRLGMEAEYILPFNMNKWGIIFEPTFQYYYSAKQMDTYNANIRFNSIDFPFGLRYYLFLNQQINLFVNSIFIPSFSLCFNSTSEHQSTNSVIFTTTLDLKTIESFAFGGGIGYKKFSAELRYYTNRNILKGYRSWISDYTRFSLILGYRIL